MTSLPALSQMIPSPDSLAFRRREPDHRREDTRFTEYSEACMLRQVRQDLKLGHQSSVELHVKGALHGATCLLRDFPLSMHKYIVRKALKRLMLARLKLFLPSRAREGGGGHWARPEIILCLRDPVDAMSVPQPRQALATPAHYPRVRWTDWAGTQPAGALVFCVVRGQDRHRGR